MGFIICVFYGTGSSTISGRLGGDYPAFYGVRHKAGKTTAKQSILVAIQRQGPVFPVPVDTVKTDTISPIIHAVADASADLMMDKSYVFHQAGKQFASHQIVYHMAKEDARGNVHINTA